MRLDDQARLETNLSGVLVRICQFDTVAQHIAPQSAMGSSGLLVTSLGLAMVSRYVHGSVVSSCVFGRVGARRRGAGGVSWGSGLVCTCESVPSVGVACVYGLTNSVFSSNTGKFAARARTRTLALTRDHAGSGQSV